MGIDIACLVVLAFAFYRGYQKGMIMAVFTVASYIIGAFAMLHLSFLVSDYITNNFNVSGTWLPILAFALTFSLAVLLIRWIGKLIEKGMTRVIPTSFNRFMGSLLYITMALIILSLIYNVAGAAEIFQDDLVATSIMAPHLEKFALIIQNNIGDVIPFVERLFNDIDSYFEEAAVKIAV
jgi:membrane protein required for colicin V production